MKPACTEQPFITVFQSGHHEVPPGWVVETGFRLMSLLFQANFQARDEEFHAAPGGNSYLYIGLFLDYQFRNWRSPTFR